MHQDFGREVCSDLSAAEGREWLVTNGIGGFASGTIAGLLTRRYHGLLIAALDPPIGRTLLLTKMDEMAEYGGRFYPLFANRWASGVVESGGVIHLDRFHLEGTIPVWTYALADALLEKRIWMGRGANTTYIQYRFVRAGGPVRLDARLFANHRDFHSTTIVNEWQPEIGRCENGLRLTMFDEATPLYLLSEQFRLTPEFDWYEDFYLSIEEYRGQNDVDEDHVFAARAQARLRPGEAVTLVASTEADPLLDGEAAYTEKMAYEQGLIRKATAAHSTPLPGPIRQLTLAADQFIVQRPTADDPGGRSIIAGYHWFSDWGRDTMIALPGLTLATGRAEVAAQILRTYAHFVNQGMLPNRFPDAGQMPEYNTVDATLWYFEAIRAYHQATGDDAVLRELFPVLEEIIAWHRWGTRYQIHLDERDGLLFAGEAGVQLTWMDAKVGDWVVTPRIGKPVEVNALWYNALCVTADFAGRLGLDAEEYLRLAEKARMGFGRFWNEALGYCYDVLDSPDGDDASLRPNQLLAVSLAHSPLTADRQQAVVDVCAWRLLTPHGLRSLAPEEAAYVGRYGGDQRQRDAGYHQGAVWGWLIGPFITAHLRVYHNPDQARSYLQPLFRHLAGHGVGSISEIFDGDPPFTPRGCIAQAWSVAELLRAWQKISGG
ncbi:MAG: amylo-alpha-1,6-glucosidase [Anaerolineae bacterium]